MCNSKVHRLSRILEIRQLFSKRLGFKTEEFIKAQLFKKPLSPARSWCFLTHKVTLRLLYSHCVPTRIYSKCLHRFIMLAGSTKWHFAKIYHECTQRSAESLCLSLHFVQALHLVLVLLPTHSPPPTQPSSHPEYSVEMCK